MFYVFLNPPMTTRVIPHLLYAEIATEFENQNIAIEF